MFFLQARTAPPLISRTTATTLITGAASGIGRAFARALAGRGCNLLLVDRDSDALAELSAELKHAHRIESDLLAIDLADADSDGALARLCRRGRIRISMLINCAAVGGNVAFARQNRDRMQSIVDVNIVAILKLTRLVLPGMIRRRDGIIVNVTSIGGYEPMPGMAVYAGTKAFLNSFTSSLERELEGTGVFVTNVCPGLTRTPMLARIGVNPDELRQQCQTPEEVVDEALRGIDRRQGLIVTGFSNRMRIRMQLLSVRSALRAIFRCARSLVGRG